MIPIKNGNVSRLPGLQMLFSVLVASLAVLLSGCLAGVPLQTEKPSDHFDVKYIETHQGSSKQEVVQNLGIPDAIFRSKERTYYVYDATGDARMIVGAVFVVPPFFVPFWAPKDEGDALHCLALVFDEKGLLQDYIAKTASEEAWGGLLVPPEPGAWPWWGEVTDCVKVLWNEEESKLFEVMAQYQRPDSLAGAAMAFAEVDGLPIIAAADWTNTVHLWDVRSDCLLDTSFSGHEAMVTSVAFGQVNNRPVLVTGSADLTVRLWDIRAGGLLGKPMRGHTGDITSLGLFEIDGLPIVFSAGEDDTVRMWNAHSGDMLGMHETAGTPLALSDVFGRPAVIIISVDRMIHVLDNLAGHSWGKQLTGHGGKVTALALGVADDQLILASGGIDNLVRFWDARSGNPLGEPLYGHQKPVTAIAFGEIDGKPVLVSSDESNTMLLWDVLGRPLPLAEPMVSVGHQVRAITIFNLDGVPVIAASSRDYNVRLWDGYKGSQLGELMWYQPVLLDPEPSEKVAESAYNGDAEAQLQMYWRIPTPDRFEWLCRSADQGHLDARYRIGILYEHGSEALPSDYVRAYQWYMMAAEVGAYWAGRAAERIKEKLTPEQMAQAERLISEWRPGQCSLELKITIKEQFNKKKCSAR